MTDDVALENLVLTWALAAIEDAISALEALREEFESADGFESRQWIARTSDWQKIVRLRRNRYDRFQREMRNKRQAPREPLRHLQAFEEATTALAELDLLSQAHTREIYEAKGLPLAFELQDTTDVSTVSKALRRRLRTIKIAIGR
jgi:hypothetical protein